MAVLRAGKRDLAPALAGWKAGFVEGAARAGLREAEQRYIAAIAGAIADQPHEALQGAIGSCQRLGDRFGRGPALAAVGGDPLGLVERGWIEPGALGKPGRRQPGVRRQPI